METACKDYEIFMNKSFEFLYFNLEHFAGRVVDENIGRTVEDEADLIHRYQKGKLRDFFACLAKANLIYICT